MEGPIGNHLRAAAVAVVLVPIGVATKLYTGPGATWIGANLGGTVYVMFFSFFVLAVRPRWSAVRIGAGVFAATTAIEVVQLWHPPFLEMLRSTVLGQAVLGGVFSWVDIPYYALGAAAAVGLARLILPPRRPDPEETSRAPT